MNIKSLVLDAYKEQLETELATRAITSSDETLADFSRSGGSYHSRSGHDFSRAQAFDDNSQTMSVLQTEARQKFVSKFLQE